MAAYKTWIFRAVLSASILLCGCGKVEAEEAAALLSPDETYEKGQTGTGVIQDLSTRYEGENEPEIVTMYLTVGRGNEGEGTDHTWAEVNRYPLSYYEEQGMEPFQCEAVLQVGDELGPLAGEFGYGDLAANATVRLRGSGASAQPQKSYRITIKNGKGSYEKQKVIALNKHSADPLRFKNRLAYGLMQEIPGLFSARTRFVHLYVKDKTEGDGGLFEDYGLYTQVEQPNKTYLKNHGLEKDGQLYQADDFDWGRHEEAIRLATDPEFSAEAFEQYLEIKGSDDHTKLLGLLEAVNDETVPISETVDRYFDRENLYRWLAFQILTGNREAATGNYYLYSPQSLNKWYFISWDNNGILSDTYEAMRDPSWKTSWDHGLFSFVDSVLFRRIFMDRQCMRDLRAAVDELYGKYLTKERIEELSGQFAAVVKETAYALPDRAFMRVNPDTYDMLAAALSGEIDTHYEEFHDSLYEPWPFHILDPVSEGGRLKLSWEEAYVTGSEEVYYTVEVSESFRFSECLFKEEHVKGTELRTDMLPEGQYFLRVRAAIPSGARQEARETYFAESGSTVYGTLCFYVLSDGSAAASRFDRDE